VARLLVISRDGFTKILNRKRVAGDYTEGSHTILQHPSEHRLSVPRHKEPSRGLSRSLIRDAGVISDIVKGRFRNGH
jgi:predicted RNA binding protein YcfA (HicA-like mRNA interferase family)